MIIIDGKLQAFDTIDHLTEHNTYYRTASKIAGTGMLPESDSFPGVPAAGV
jgi:hypothetical protein